jgi:primary-amine oxidase
MVDPWSAGHFGIEEEDEGNILARAICWIKKFLNDRGYAYPLTNNSNYFPLLTIYEKYRQVIRIDNIP